LVRAPVRWAGSATRSPPSIGPVIDALLMALFGPETGGKTLEELAATTD
jgi:hypothetical protein